MFATFVAYRTVSEKILRAACASNFENGSFHPQKSAFCAAATFETPFLSSRAFALRALPVRVRRQALRLSNRPTPLRDLPRRAIAPPAISSSKPPRSRASRNRTIAAARARISSQPQTLYIVLLSVFYYHNIVISNIINVSFQSKSCKATAQSLFCRNAGAGRPKAPNPLTALSAGA